MIVQLFTVFRVLLATQAARLKLPSKYAGLVNDLNSKAKEAGLGPIAEAVRDGFNINDATSIQEIKSMEELKSIDEITHMKEIKSMQEIPDDVADKFIEDEGLVPIKSLSDPIPPSYPATSGGSGCSAVKEELRSLQGDLNDMMEKMSDRIRDIIEALDDAPIEVGEPEVIDPIIIPEFEPEPEPEPKYTGEKLNGEDIVNVTPIKDIQEIKSITPIKSIQEVVGIYALTDEQARRLRSLSMKY